MGCDCKKTYNIGMGCCQPVLAPADNFYTKYQTDMRIEEAISGITVSGITEEQAEEMIEEATSGKANSSDVYTKQETDTLLDNKQDKLIAGQGISISDTNVISVTGGTSGSVTQIEHAWGDIFGHDLYITQYGGENAGPKIIAKSGEGIIINRTDGEPRQYDGVIRCDFNTVQRKLSAGTGIDITNNVISVTGGSQPVDAYTKAESDAKFATITNFNSHSGDTTVHITAQERTTWNAKPNVWCGNESEWSQISGSTESGTIYLVY